MESGEDFEDWDENMTMELDDLMNANGGKKIDADTATTMSARKNGKELRFFKFLTEKELRQAWIIAIQRDESPFLKV